MFSNHAVRGWASAIAVVSFLFGILFILIGTVGGYLARIYEEVKGRPRFIIREDLGIKGALFNDSIAYSVRKS